MRPSQLSVLAVLLGIVTLSLSGCRQLSPETIPTATTPPENSDPTAVPPLPTAPTITESVALYTAGIAPATRAAYVAALDSAAQSRGLDFVELADLSAPPDGVRFLVVIADVDAVAAVSEAHPEIKILAIADERVDGPSVSWLAPTTRDHRAAAFIAGYLSAVVTEEWRVGLLTSPDEDGKAFQSGFQNGANYFCGLCQQVFAPHRRYPLVVEVVDLLGIESGARTFAENDVRTIFLGVGLPDGLSPDSFGSYPFVYLGTNQIGTMVPGWWAGAVGFSAIPANLDAIISAWLDGEDGGQPAGTWPIEVLSQDAGVVSVGRLEFMQGVIGEIEQGVIEP